MRDVLWAGDIKSFGTWTLFYDSLSPAISVRRRKKEIGRERAERLRGQKTTRSSLKEVSNTADFEIGEMEKPL